jgi:hypothetical protein
VLLDFSERVLACLFENNRQGLNFTRSGNRKKAAQKGGQMLINFNVGIPGRTPLTREIGGK